LDLVTDAHWEVRVAALEALAKLRDAKSGDRVLRCLKDPDKEVRQQAADTLGQLGLAEAVPSLIATLVDEESSVRQAAARALPKIDPHWEYHEATRLALDPIREALHHSNHAVQYAAAGVLRRIGESRTKQAEAAQAANTSIFGRGRDATSILIELLSDEDPDIRQAVAGSLGRLRAKEAVEPLRRALMDSKREVREAAEEALSSLT
jgi:HEAT repeat protein